MESWESRLLAAGNRAASERIATIADLVSDWHGLVMGVETVPAFVPGVLRQFYDRVGGCLGSVCRQNRILAPGELRVLGGKLEFAVENQNVFRWAIDASDGSDASVFSRFDEADPWTADVPVLSLFLLQFIVFELLMAAPFGASASGLEKSRLDAILSGMMPLPWPHWHRPAYPGKFFVRGNAFAFCCPNRGPEEVDEDAPWSFWLGAKDATELAFIKPQIDPGWEYVSLG